MDDDNLCCDDTHSKCNYADMHFSLKATSKAQNIPHLGIDTSSGQIYLDENGPLSPGRYEYKVLVSNPDGLQGAAVPLTVFVDKNIWNSVVKSRQLRAAPSTTVRLRIGL